MDITTIDTDSRTGKTSRDRRSMILIGCVTAALAAAHLLDHALRGRQVHIHDLDPDWNHSGWPFEERVTPYTFSLIAVALVLDLGIVFTHRGKLWAGYWLASAIGLGALVTFVHLLPTAKQESPYIIYNSWPGRHLVGSVSVLITFAIVIALSNELPLPAGSPGCCGQSRSMPR